MDLQSRVGWSGHFFFFFYVSGGKNDPKNTKILKTNQTFFAKKIFGKTFWFIFQPKLLNFGQTMADFTRFCKIRKKNSPKVEKMGR